MKRTRLVLWWIGLAGFAIMMASVVTTLPRDPLIFFSSLILTPQEAMFYAGFVLGSASWLATALCAAARHLQAPHHVGPGAQPTNSPWLPKLRLVARTITVIAIALVTPVVAILTFAFADSYAILNPSSRGGCKVVVAASGGPPGVYEIYLMEPGRRTLVNAGTTWSSEGTPVTRDAFQLAWIVTWEGTAVDLRVQADGSPDTVRIDSHQHPIKCAF